MGALCLVTCPMLGAEHMLTVSVGDFMWLMEEYSVCVCFCLGVLHPICVTFNLGNAWLRGKRLLKPVQ